MNRNNLPLFIMLLAGAFTAVMTTIFEYSLKRKLALLLIVLLIFYFLGSLMKWVLNYFEQENAKAKHDGEVIEKGTETEKDEESESELEKEKKNDSKDVEQEEKTEQGGGENG